jgi:hypothetical protein
VLSYVVLLQLVWQVCAVLLLSGHPLFSPGEILFDTQGLLLPLVLQQSYQQLLSCAADTNVWCLNHTHCWLDQLTSTSTCHLPSELFCTPDTMLITIFLPLSFPLRRAGLRCCPAFSLPPFLEVPGPQLNYSSCSWSHSRCGQCCAHSNTILDWLEAAKTCTSTAANRRTKPDNTAATAGATQGAAVLCALIIN